MYDDIKRELEGLATVSEEELHTAKVNMKIRILSGIEEPAYRLDETLRNIRTYGSVMHHQYINWIDSVTVNDLKSVVQAVLKGRPSLVASGGNVAILTNVA
jgi:predicted Zn-dependent peptidase